ncbi:hypothetical protein [Mycobacterium tuberculosis]|nr:hypothetical protein [Mycobacterium tuberculosis]
MPDAIRAALTVDSVKQGPPPNLVRLVRNRMRRGRYDGLDAPAWRQD